MNYQFRGLNNASKEDSVRRIYFRFQHIDRPLPGNLFPHMTMNLVWVGHLGRGVVLRHGPRRIVGRSRRMNLGWIFNNRADGA